jgi:hypothetical protein
MIRHGAAEQVDEGLTAPCGEKIAAHAQHRICAIGQRTPTSRRENSGGGIAH